MGNKQPSQKSLLSQTYQSNKDREQNTRLLLTKSGSQQTGRRRRHEQSGYRPQFQDHQRGKMCTMINNVNNISLRYPQGFKMERVHPLVKALYSFPVGPLAGRLSLFYSNWKKLTQDPNILNIIQGFETPFLEKPYQTKLPNPQVPRTVKTCQGGSQGNKVKKGNTGRNTVQKSVHKQSLSDIKKGWGESHGNKCETSEQFHPLPTFQNGGTQFASKHATGKGFHMQIRPKQHLLFCATKKRKQEICAFPMGRDTL